MPPKRRRRGSQSTDVHNDSEDTSSLPGVSVSKRRKIAANDCIEICQELYDSIRSEQLDNGVLICEPFVKLPKKKTDPEYFEAIANPIDLTMIQQKIKSGIYEDVEQMANDIEQLVNNAKSYYAEASLECQQADVLWDLFCECKLRIVGDEASYIGDEDGDDSRLSSATDDISRSILPAGDAVSECLKVPVLKLKVGSVGGYVDSAQADCANHSAITQANECSSDFEGASENQSISTTQGRLSSCSEIDDQLTTECPRVIIKPMKKLDNLSEGVMGLRERRYAYRDFITPKQKRRKMPDATAGNEKEADGAVDENESADNVYEQLLAAVTSATDGNRLLCEAFKILPLRSKYVDYYQVIKEPIDLRTIAQKIQASSYGSLDEMAKDLLLMVQNAKTFNKPNSTIYKDAVALRKIVIATKNELEQPIKAASATSSSKSRARCSGPLAAVSSALAVLRGESEDEELSQSDIKSKPGNNEPVIKSSNKAEDGGGSDADESSSDEETSDLWTLFKTIYNYRTNLGLRLAEPFIRLPSRRIYPDYYQEIKKPLSLTKIRKKIRSESYSDLDDLAADFNLVFENAKQYNVEESKIYKDAVKLQGMLNTKKHELQPIEKLKCERPSNRSRQTTPDTPVDDSSNSAPKRKRVRSASSDDVLKKRLMTIHKYLMDYQFDGRHLIDIFITLPSKKDYPDYYKVISEPIDMTIIENKIKADKYPNQHELVEDLELMFKNARHYNEELSQVYKDAETLERQLHSRIRSLPPIDDGSPDSSAKFQPRNSFGRPKVKSVTTLPAKLQELYNAVRDYADAHGRILSTPFMKLPSRNEYPDYYDVIKKPMDMQKVLQKMTGSQYSSVDDMASDFVLMFDNACRYNEPDSLIYKDALTLQHACLNKKSELGDDNDSNEVPDIPNLVQSLLTSLFVSTFSHMDEEGRCFADSFLELPTRMPSEDDSASQTVRLAPSFEQIKHNLDQGRYRRLDRFQEDMFEVFEYARKVSSVDTQVYEDSVELQLYFIQQRDELCRKGEVLLSAALNYTDIQLKAMLDSVRRERISNEQHDEDEQKKEVAGQNCSDSQSVSCNGKDKSCDTVEHSGLTYDVGDFVYVEPRDRDKGLLPQIVCIERLWKGDDGDTGLYGCWFLRPNETFHLATRKFLQKEVFKSDFYDNVSFHKVLGKCHVMFVKDYFRSKPQGFADSDVHVCESRYSGRGKCFKKIKIWQVPKNERISLVAREQPIPAVRVASVFADSKTTVDGGINPTDRVVDSSQTSVLDVRREPVRIDQPPSFVSEEGCVYYEQVQSPSCWLKLGDCVYLKSLDGGDQPIMMIEKLWANTISGESFLSGPYYIASSKVEHAPNRLFYRKEVFHTSREGIMPLSSVTGRCAVLSYKEYCTSRFTEVAESDVYVCESKYSDVDKVIKKFNRPFKQFCLSENICGDEVYFFKKPIALKKELLPFLPRIEDIAAVDDESMDCPSSVDQSFNDAGSCQGDSTLDNTPSSNKKRKSLPKANNKIRQISGYIVYAAECRKDIQAEFPGQTFGDISRIVGNKWKSLPKELKDRYEDKARAIAADHAAKSTATNPIVLAQYPAQNVPSPGATDMHSQSPNLISAQSGYNIMAVQNGNASVYCNPLSGPPPSAVQPSQVISPMHHQLANQAPPRMLSQFPPGPGQQPNCPPYHHGMVPHLVAPYSIQQPVGYPNAAYQGPVAPPAAPKPPPPPMFASVPPQTQRLVHTEAYLRYIEGMSSGSPTIGGWEKSLNAKAPDNAATVGTEKLPVHWLANGAGHHDNAVSALWALRDHMMKDAFTVSRVLDFSQV